ncbi:hypothetical protein C3F09_05260 [candidate division GN15 bacterium]|uniref:Tetratricopeptide repeat protein n=1 Tax=candidate division GN15 bacterium TaxID=2072418 RepID=A0A855X8R9_9BACT|nr:MAG: hypothetical protein C3F09_05260 [candidate division GN15 bacterium]
MRMNPRIVVVAVCALCVSAALCFGQSQPPQSPPSGQTFTIQSVGGSQENRQRVMTARQLMADGNYEAASALLEIVYEQEPGNQAVTGMLRTCYYQLKQYLKAETLVRRLLAVAPDQFGLRLELAELLADQGEADSSKAAYHDAMAGIPVQDTSRYLLIIRSEMSRNLGDEALKLIDSLRRQSGNSLLFALEQGSILETQKNYTPAADIYLTLLAGDSTSSAMEAERRLIAMLGFPESAGAVEARLAREAGTVKSRRVLQLLEDYTLKAGQFDKAFAYCVRRDSLERSDGAPLLYYMRRCAERKQYAEVIKMGQYALSRYPSAALTQLVTMSYAGALGESGRYNDAIAQYEAIRASSPRPQDRGDAVYAEAMVYMDKLREYPRALGLLDTVLGQYRFGNLFLNSMRDRARCFMRMGNLDSADEAYITVARQTNLPDLREEAAYYDGLIYLFRNKYDSCKSALKKLLVNYPSGFYVNDAMQLLMVLDDAGDSPDIMAMYANAELYSERYEWDSARTWFDRLTLADNKALADDALDRMLQISLKVTDTAAALDAVERLVTGYPDSYFAPYGLKAKADILLAGRGTRQQAREIYMQLLQQYPNYPFATDVRKRLRQLDADKIG